MPPKPTRNPIEDQLAYDSETGFITWKVSKSGTRLGQRTLYVDNLGYGIIRVNRKNYKAHRLAWFLHFGEWPQGELDHINRIKTDNRISNLRISSRSANMINTEARSSSGEKNIYWYPKLGKWCVSIRRGLTNKTVGYYSTLDKAVEARNYFLQQYYLKQLPRTAGTNHDAD